MRTDWLKHRRLAPWLAKKLAWCGWDEPKVAITVATAVAVRARIFWEGIP